MTDLQSSHILLAVLLGAFVLLVARLRKVGSREAFLPPGPPTLPVIGNLHQLPLQYSHLKLTKWARKYGPIYSLKLGPSTMIILSGAREVKEILDRRSGVTSARPNLHVANELITNGRHLLAMDHGPRWRLVRKIIHQHLTIQQCKDHHQSVQEAESVKTMHDLLTKPDDFYNQVRRYSTAVVLSVVYGMRAPEWKDAADIYEVMDPWSEIVETGATPPVDIFTFIKRMPDFLSPWRRKALHVRKLELILYGKMVDRVKARRAQNIDRGSLLDKALDMQAENGDPLLDDEQIAYIGGVLLEGGSDTTSSLMLAFIQAMCAFPDVLRKAQAEVDEVVGRNRLPNFGDWDRLPYIHQCVKEVQRWRPVVVTAFPHQLTRDEGYNGYVLPKGATIIGNTWALHHDPARFDRPDEFRPERFVDYPLTAPEYAAMAGDNDRDHYGYGYGRRICVGLHVAERSMFLNIARVCWSFNITEDPKHPVDIHSYTPGFLMAPKPFKCQITPRDGNVSKVIERELAEAQSTFARFED